MLPVPDGHLDAIRPHVSSAVWALLAVIRLTGARPGELLGLRALDLDTTVTPWEYRPTRHKTAHRGRGRLILFGPEARDLLTPFMAGRSVDTPLFSPRVSNAERKALGGAVGRRPNQRDTPRKTGRRMQDAYTTASLARCVVRACRHAGIDPWTPGQLRHNAATDLRRRAGIDAAAAVLGRVDVHRDFNGNSTRYRYEADPRYGGRLREEQRFWGRVDATPDEKTVYAYDALGRRALVNEYAGGNMAAAVRTSSYEYDPVTGGLTREQTPEGIIRRTYDPASGRLIRTWTADNDTHYAYDLFGRLQTVTQTKVNGTTLSTPRVTTYAYDAVGRLDLTVDDNGTATVDDDLVHDYTYDGLNRLSNLVARQGDGDKLFEQTFSHRVDGQKSGVVEHRYANSGGGVFSTTTITWDYDGAGRLIEEMYDAPGVALDYTTTYGFDLNGNRIFKSR